MQSPSSFKTSTIQSSPITRPSDNFQQRSIEYARQLHQVRENEPFMNMMKSVFQHCDAMNIAKLIKYNGLGGSISSISLEECCQNTPELAEEIKQVAGDFFEKPLLLSGFYLKGSEAELLLKICNFGITEDDEKTLAKIKALESLLFIDNSSNAPLPPTEFSSTTGNQISPSSPESQSDDSVALEKAKSFEKTFLETADTRFPDESVYGKAVEYYIKAANLGNVVAKKWLESAASGKLPVNGQIWIALGNIYSKENAGEELINECYDKAWGILFHNAERGDLDAIQILYGTSIGEKPAGEINQILDDLLLSRIKTASLQDSTAKGAREWILHVFSSPNLPPSYNAKREEALLAVVQNTKFQGTFDSAWAIFRYGFHEYGQVRALIEAKLNKNLGVQDPIKLSYVATSHNHNTFLICPENESDNDRFVLAVKKSELAEFFSASTNLSQEFNMVYENCLELTNKSWSSFTTLLSRS